MKKFLALTMVVALVLTSLVGCTTATTSSSEPAAEAKADDAAPAEEAKAEKKVKKQEDLFVGILFDSLTVESRVRQRDAFVAYAEELGIDLVFQDAALSEKTQMEQAENLLSQGVDAICILAHNADAMKPLSDMCKKDDCLFVCTDRVIEGVSMDYFIGLDNDAVGFQQAEFCLEHAPKGNYVLLCGASTDPNAIQWKGIWDEMLAPSVEKGDINIVFEEYTENWDATIAATNLENALTMCDDDCACVMAMADCLANGAIQALKQRGLDGKVVMTGLDGETGAYQRIAEGTQSMTLQIDDETVAKRILDVIVADQTGGDVDQFLTGTFNNGYGEIPAAIIPYIQVNSDNILEMIDRGFADYETTYENVPADKRPR